MKECDICTIQLRELACPFASKEYHTSASVRREQRTQQTFIVGCLWLLVVADTLDVVLNIRQNRLLGHLLVNLGWQQEFFF